MTLRHTLTLAATFFRDHDDRCESGECEIVRDGARRVTIRCDDDYLADLASDADYYGGSAAPDWEEGDAIRRSAQAVSRVVRAYLAQEAAQ